MPRPLQRFFYDIFHLLSILFNLLLFSTTNSLLEQIKLVLLLLVTHQTLRKQFSLRFFIFRHNFIRVNLLVGTLRSVVSFWIASCTSIRGYFFQRWVLMLWFSLNNSGRLHCFYNYGLGGIRSCRLRLGFIVWRFLPRESYRIKLLFLVFHAMVFQNATCFGTFTNFGFKIFLCFN